MGLFSVEDMEKTFLFKFRQPVKKQPMKGVNEQNTGPRHQTFYGPSQYRCKAEQAVR